MTRSGKAVLDGRVRRASGAGEPPQRVVPELSESEAMQLGDAVVQFHAATAKAVKTVDEAPQAARQGNRRIDEFNTLILAKLDELDGRKPVW